MGQTYGHVARSVAERKLLHPELYCKYCLWNTAMLNAARDGYILNANPCPRHPIMRGCEQSTTDVKASDSARRTDGKSVTVGGSNPPPRCGQCDRVLIDNPATDNTLPFYCPSCDIVYDWEDFD